MPFIVSRQRSGGETRKQYPVLIAGPVRDFRRPMPGSPPLPEGVYLHGARSIGQLQSDTWAASYAHPMITLHSCRSLCLDQCFDVGPSRCCVAMVCKNRQSTLRDSQGSTGKCTGERHRYSCNRLAVAGLKSQEPSSTVFSRDRKSVEEMSALKVSSGMDSNRACRHRQQRSERQMSCASKVAAYTEGCPSPALA